MDPQQAMMHPATEPSNSRLLIKLTNPYNQNQLNDLHTSPQHHSPSLDSLQTPSNHKEDSKLKESSSKGLDDDSVSGSSSGGDNLEDSAQKSNKRVYTKRTTDKIRRWTKDESKLYEDFIEMYSDIFNDSSSKRVTKIFIFMANYIGTKTPSQCRSHHQKFFRRIQREKLLSSGKATNEEELEKLMPKKRKKKTDKNNKENQEEIKVDLLLEQNQLPSTKRIPDEEPVKQEVVQPNLVQEQGMNSVSTLNNNGYYQEELEQTNDSQQQPNGLNFIENDGYGKMVDAPSQFMNLKRNYEAFRKISNDKEWMTLFNNKTRRKSSISMLFNNNYFYQTDPELSNLDFMHKPANFIDDSLGVYNPVPSQPNGGYQNYPPSNYYYYPPPPAYSNGYGYGYDNAVNNNSVNSQNNNDDYIQSYNDEKDKGSAVIKAASKPVIENQEIKWKNAIDNVDVIEKYLKTMGEKS